MSIKQWISDSLKNSIILVMENKHHSLYKWPSEIVNDLSNDFGPIKMRINNFVSELNKAENPIALMLKAHELLKATENIADQRVLSAFILGFNAYQNKSQLEIRQAHVLSHTDDFDTIKQAVKSVDDGAGPHAASWEVIEMAAHTFRDLLIADEREKIARDIEQAQQEPQNHVIVEPNQIVVDPVVVVPPPFNQVAENMQVVKLTSGPQALVVAAEVLVPQQEVPVNPPLVIARQQPVEPPLQVAANIPATTGAEVVGVEAAAAEAARVVAQNTQMRNRR